MSIKQGDYLKRLRIERGLSQEKLSEALGLSRQSISKWEQGNSSPEIDNIKKLSEYFGVSVESIINGEPDSIEDIINRTEQKPQNSAETKEKAEEQTQKQKKKRGWLFPSYPVLMVILYCILGSAFSPKGWYMGWLVLLTIPLYYTGVIAAEKKKPIIFCYPVLAVMIFLLLGLGAGLWHPAWIIFLTIPIFYIITAKMKNKS
ncbi:MAG: helix-turn-helix domain-containing protein [Acetobacter sp.]|nr:helix-turn-helix domain-containing protein [Bacteroides sp.]MCM1340354.1 helix-turn-helix domain-containing protein [Acetobacter sp.]MCM1432999.1 helix-turn-helix domain-containing protein [Clostridiales bacterium]